MLTWLNDERFVIGDATFRAIPAGASQSEFMGAVREAANAGEFFIAKPRWRVEKYVDVLDRLRPQNIFELGIFQGGSTVLFAEVARPRRLVAIDKRPGGSRPLEQYVSRRRLSDAVRTYGDVDQADAGRLAEIVDECFDGEALDLVVDDCSHDYEATRASFNELFPRLRPGGLYVIEDWPWAHTAVGADNIDGLLPEQMPLTRLAFELVLAIPGMPGLIPEITIDSNTLYVERGESAVDPSTFDVAACSNPRGRSLLAPL
jgi:SAM-dependent methyltransferase